ncbi:hypothetical protein EXE59_16390 [Nocardioides eburneiflavus]|uniref:Uncharacterized protein n=1 Tax=Nocardioides eburneiflavus TaxID=2518372 RepID=A0A4Z1CKJ7_9ACTN|nr:hypothetical protein [Nocardioides eburneiflavus]TGN65363.1 hypothetical protein EXE59_16390 [Nocardioides eburneiflavus]
MRSLSLVPAGRAGAVYDVAVTVPFATPWTAGLVLGAFAWLHDVLNLPADAPPSFESGHMIYVVLFGIVTTMWGSASARPSRQTAEHPWSPSDPALNPKQAQSPDSVRPPLVAWSPAPFG